MTYFREPYIVARLWHVTKLCILPAIYCPMIFSESKWQGQRKGCTSLQTVQRSQISEATIVKIVLITQQYCILQCINFFTAAFCNIRHDTAPIPGNPDTVQASMLIVTMNSVWHSIKQGSQRVISWPCFIQPYNIIQRDHSRQ